jgi:hypothetical protein
VTSPPVAALVSPQGRFLHGRFVDADGGAKKTIWRLALDVAAMKPARSTAAFDQAVRHSRRHEFAQYGSAASRPGT